MCMGYLVYLIHWLACFWEVQENWWTKRKTHIDPLHPLLFFPLHVFYTFFFNPPTFLLYVVEKINSLIKSFIFLSDVSVTVAPNIQCSSFTAFQNRLVQKPLIVAFPFWSLYVLSFFPFSFSETIKYLTSSFLCFRSSYIGLMSEALRLHALSFHLHLINRGH